MRHHVQLGIVPMNELAVVPNLFRLRDRHECSLPRLGPAQTSHYIQMFWLNPTNSFIGGISGLHFIRRHGVTDKGNWKPRSNTRERQPFAIQPTFSLSRPFCLRAPSCPSVVSCLGFF